MKAPEVRAWVCSIGTDDYGKGPILANNQHGIAGSYGNTVKGEGRIGARDVRWEGIPWRVAHDANGGVLYVLAPTREVVETHRGALERLAVVVADRGGVDHVVTELRTNGGMALAPRMATAKPMPKPSDKRLALNAITQAVMDALERGASMQDVRLAVFSAMGLDSDAA